MESLHVHLQLEVEKIQELHCHQTRSDATNDPMCGERCHKRVQILLDNLDLGLKIDEASQSHFEGGRVNQPL